MEELNNKKKLWKNRMTKRQIIVEESYGKNRKK